MKIGIYWKRICSLLLVLLLFPIWGSRASAEDGGLLEEERPHFSLKLRYVGEELVEAVLDGKVLSEEDKRAMILGRQAFLQGKGTGEQ